MTKREGPQYAPLGEPFPQPSMYQRKDRLRDDPDLIAAYQLQGIALAYLMEDRGITSFTVPAVRVHELRMTAIGIEADESERLQVRIES